MTIIFASPAGTGKTIYGTLLAKHFGCSSVIEAEDLGRMSDAALQRGKLDDALILCISADEVAHSPYIRCRRTLQREEMNAAMVAVCGTPIWNEDDSVNYGRKQA